LSFDNVFAWCHTLAQWECRGCEAVGVCLLGGWLAGLAVCQSWGARARDAPLHCTLHHSLGLQWNSKLSL